MPDKKKVATGGDSFAELFVNSAIGDKYSDSGNPKPQQPKPRRQQNPRPPYDGGATYLTNGVDRRILRQLKKCQAEDSIDLHGMTEADACEALEEFINAAQHKGYRDVEVIHGKGAGILKPAARKWLAQCAEVRAFAEVGNNSGAVRVFLRA